MSSPGPTYYSSKCPLFPEARVSTRPINVVHCSSWPQPLEARDTIYNLESPGRRLRLYSLRPLLCDFTTYTTSTPFFYNVTTSNPSNVGWLHYQGQARRRCLYTTSCRLEHCQSEVFQIRSSLYTGIPDFSRALWPPDKSPHPVGYIYQTPT